MPGSPTFSRLFEEHRGSVVRYVRRRLGDDAAEGAAIEVFGHAAAARSNDHARYGSVRAWLYAMATEAVSERWRIERRRLEALEHHTYLPPTRHPALETTSPLDPGVANGLRHLTSAVRETLLLIAWGELTTAEAAATLGVPVPLVHDRLVGAHALIMDGTRGRGDDGRGRARGVGTTAPSGGDRATVTVTAAEIAQLLAALSDNADLGLDPVRQPRIESAVSRRYAAAPPHWSFPGGEAQFLGT